MPSYRDQVVCFLDIMGFREIVKSRTADEITLMLDLIQATAAGTGSSGAQVPSVISFSDSVIRALPCSSDPITALKQEVEELAKAQWELMDNEILVRGGITIGQVLITANRAFGPAFVRAYELESSWAGSPRIVIDPGAIEIIRKQIRKTSSTEAKRKLVRSIRRAVSLDGDGIWFVDYISYARRSVGITAHHAAMKRHRDHIIKSANMLKPGSSVLAKYLWLIRYFNNSVKKHHANDISLKIKRTDVPLSDDLLIPAFKKPDAGQISAATKIGKKR